MTQTPHLEGQLSASDAKNFFEAGAVTLLIIVNIDESESPTAYEIIAQGMDRDKKPVGTAVICCPKKCPPVGYDKPIE